MKYLRQTYTDPTGGGDDLFIVYPEWAEVPSSVRAHTGEDGEPVEFEADGEPLSVDKPFDV